MFGINSLDDLKYEIFQKTQSLKTKNTDILNQNYISVLRNQKFLKKAREAIEIFAPAVGLKESSSALFKSAFNLVKNQIICIDDLERAGDDLKLRDVLGLASLLKEERSVKVVILLNSKKLDDKNREDFSNFLEKVCDVILEMEITVEEACAIGLSELEFERNYAKECIELLEINNIRIIEKIKNYLQTISCHLASFDDAVRRQAVETVVLGCWASYLPDKAPDFELLKAYDRTEVAIRTQNSEKKPLDWEKYIQTYPFVRADDLDRELLNGVKRGWFDWAKIESSAVSTQAQIRTNSRDNSFDRAWEEKFHGSLSVDDEEFLSALFEGAIENLSSISIMNINSAVRMLRKNKKDKEANTVVDEYIKAHNGESFEFFNLDSNHFLKSDEVDKYLNQKFDEKAKALVEMKSPADVLKKFGEERGWNNEDVLVLRGVSSEEYEKMFEAMEGPGMRRSIDTLLNLIRSSPSRAEMLREPVISALRRIAAKSPLRALKVARFGIEIEPDADGPAA